MSAFATLRNLAAAAKAPPQAQKQSERCEMCGASLLPNHRHLLEPVARRLICSCDACASLFFGAGETKYKRVPRDARSLAEFRLDDAQWDSLMLPIGLAFFVNNSVENKVIALYPSPAGPTESLLPLNAWADIVAENPVLANMEPDVEGLLVNRLGECAEYYLAPIDKCYELVGLIRANWQGFSGGPTMWEKVHAFFAAMRENGRA